MTDQLRRFKIELNEKQMALIAAALEAFPCLNGSNEEQEENFYNGCIPSQLAATFRDAEETHENTEAHYSFTL